MDVPRGGPYAQASASARSRRTGRVSSIRARANQQRWRALAKDIARAFALELVFRVHKLGVPTAQRNSHDLETAPFECQDFAPDEAVADRGILVDQIGNAHDDVTCIR